jgi:hypothetical protein
MACLPRDDTIDFLADLPDKDAFDSRRDAKWKRRRSIFRSMACIVMTPGWMYSQTRCSIFPFSKKKRKPKTTS